MGMHEIPRSINKPYVDTRDLGIATGSGAASANATLINSALAAAGAAGVWLPRGTFYYDSPIIPVSNTQLIGAGRGVTTLIYTGSGNAVQVLGIQVFRFTMEGITIKFGGSGSTAHGLNATKLTQSRIEDMVFRDFPGDGVHLDGSLASAYGCWSNRLIDIESVSNNGHGFYFGENSNAVYGFGLLSTFNTLDGYWIGKKARVWIDGQAESNGRHAASVWGADYADLGNLYVEHADPSASASRNAGFSASTTRHVVHIGPSGDGTKCGTVKVGGYLEGRDDSGVTTVTKAAVFAEDNAVNHLLLPEAIYANIGSNRAVQIGVGNGPVTQAPANVNGVAEDASHWGQYLAARYDLGSSGNRAVDFRGSLSRAEGFVNLLVNGGFDADLAAATTLPQGWTQLATTTYAYETGTDGGNRLILTNSGSNQSGVYQDVTGRAVAYMVKEGKGVVSFDVIAPTANARNKCQVRVRCHTGGGSAIAGGGLESWFIPASNTETHYAIPFAVPATTTTIRIYLLASDGGVSNSDVLKVDRVGLWQGEFEKAWSAKPLTESGGRLFNGVQLPTKAGAFTDADFPTPPPINSLVGYDTANDRVYFKNNSGVMKYMALT